MSVAPPSGGPGSGYRTFLVPYDFSAHSRAALYAACDLARRLEASLHLVHVVQLPPYAFGYGPYAGAGAPPPVEMAELHESAAKALREVIDDLEDLPGTPVPHVIDGQSVADGLLDSADKVGADLIVMGTHGRTGFAHVFLGSVAERVLRRAPCPVLTVRAPDENAEED